MRFFRTWFPSSLRRRSCIVSFLAPWKLQLTDTGKVNTLSELALQLDITKLDIPPAVYIYDRKFEPEIILPGFPPSPVFGRPPFNNFANPPRVGDATPLPQVLVEASTYIRRSCLGQEGLFRIPPSNVILEAARDCYDRRTSLRWEDWGVHTAAGLIKLYYRLLPEPMIPASCYEQMQSLVVTDPSRRPSPETEVQARFEVVRALLTAEVSGLPLFSRILFLRHLLPLLSEVAAHSEQNKMTPVNLAVCVSGSLARSDNLEADARALGGIRIFLEIALKHIDDLAPKLPLRRGAGGMPTAEKRRSQASISSLDDAPSTSNSGSSSRSSIPRKQVPSIALPLWEPQDKEPAILRRVPAPQREALVEIPMQISQPEKSEGRRLGAPMGPRPQPPRTRSRGRPEHEETAAAPTPSPRFTPNSSTETLPLLPRDHTPLHHPHNPTTGPLSHPYNPPTVPPKIALRPVSSYSSLRGPTKLPATTVLSVAGTGTFARPALRRVVSTNSLGPAIVQRRASFELESTGETELAAPQGLRRARSQLIQRSGGGVLKEKTSAGGGVSGLREMFEAKARADAEKAAR